ncbi:MAG: PrgI family protein [Candidatus Paceibacterota bacterium]
MPVPVPQFIKEETKIMGIITFTQLGILTGGGGFLVFLYFVLKFEVWAILALIGVPLLLALTFGQVEGVPLSRLFPYMLRHLWVPKNYLWYKEKVSSISLQPKLTQKVTSPQKQPSLAKKELDPKMLEEISKYLDQ